MADQFQALDWKGYEGKDYEQFWVGPGRKYLDELEHLVISHCLPGGDTVADIGAGFGRLTNCYIEKYHTVHLVEPATNLRKAAQETYREAAIYHDASVTALPFESNSLDAVLMVRVFHHLGDPSDALREIHRVLKHGGWLVYKYSNKRNIKRLVRLTSASHPLSRGIERYGQTLFGHHPAYVDDALTTAGFMICEEFGVGFIDKVVNVMPSAGRIFKPSLNCARVIGRLRLAPSQFLVAEKAR